MKRGRKFRAFLVGLAILTGGLVWGTYHPAAVPMFAAFATGVVALVVGFIGTHTVSEWTPAATWAAKPRREL